MPLRLGPNGGVAKPSSSTNGQRPARPPASKVIDLTRDITNETNQEVSRECSTQEKRKEDASERYDQGSRDERGGQRSSGAGTQERTIGVGQGTVGQPQMDNSRKITRPAQDFVLEDSFIVTSLHHHPWEYGDDVTIIGLFPTEREAKDAVFKDFHQRCTSQADGWTHEEWDHSSRDGTLQFCGYGEDVEDDSFWYKASIKRVQQKRAAAVPPSLPNPARPNPRSLQPRYVYVVKEEQREYVGTDDPHGFYNEEGDLKAVNIHGIYADLDAANEEAREVYEYIVEDFADDAETITDDFEDGMAAIVVTDPLEEMTYSISVEKESLR
ncbi:hypothetical protein BDR22DRAFT_892113 [Usnea florida]